MASIINATTSTGLVSSADNSGSLQLATNNGTTAVTIDTAQQIGVGTTNPSNFGNSNNRGITVNGQGTAGFVEMQSSGTAYGAVYANSSNAGIRSITALPLTFETNATERMRITSDGDLLIGETGGTSKLSITQSSNSSTAIRIVYSGTGAFPIEAITSNASYTGAGIRSRVQNLAAGTGYYAFSYYNDNAADYRFLVLGNGNVQNTNNSYGALSDVKLKENIVDATPKLEDLCKVKVRQYNLKSDPNHKQIGVVAQELEEVFAGLVEETQDRDVDGKYLGTTTKQVKYSVFVPMLIKALQELNAKVEAQAVRIVELEGAK
jgi:hypothetical protein